MTSHILEILGFIVGLLYLWWEYHADARVWLASVIMPAISMWIYFSKGIYADFAINIYYLIIAIYGYVIWRTGGIRKEKKPQPITHTPIAVWAGIAAVTALLWWALTWSASAASFPRVCWQTCWDGGGRCWPVRLRFSSPRCL